MRQRPFFSLAFAVTAAISCTWAHAEDWPQFRGPRANGTSPDTKAPVEWSDTKNVQWKFDMPGAGFSSPIVVGEQVLVTAYSTKDRTVLRHLISLDRKTGKQNWEASIAGVSDKGEGGFAHHGQASHTPVSDGERVYAMFGSSGVFAFDLQGKQLWNKELGNMRASQFGTSSSPILYKDKLIVTAGAESEAIWAFNKETGEQLWKSEAGSLSGSYSTPTIATNTEDKDVLLISVVGELWGINPDSGKLRWYAQTKVDTAACPSLVIHDKIAYVIGGRGGGRTAVRVLAKKGDATNDAVVWSESGGSYVPSPVLHDGKLYWVNDRGIGTCVDAATGKELNAKRIGGKYYGSLTLINDKLYAVSRDDGVRVFKATPDFEQISHNKLSDDGDFSGSLAVSNGQIFMRSDKTLYCISSSEPQQ